MLNSLSHMLSHAPLNLALSFRKLQAVGCAEPRASATVAATVISEGSSAMLSEGSLLRTPPLRQATAATATHSRWNVTTKHAAQEFLVGVQLRVPMAAIFTTNLVRTTCNVACSDVEWVETVLDEVGATRVDLLEHDEPTAFPAAPMSPESLSNPDACRSNTASNCSSASVSCFFIDVFVDDRAEMLSWIRDLQQQSAREGINKVVLLLETLISAFPGVAAGQAWVHDTPADSHCAKPDGLRLLSFVNFPDDPHSRQGRQHAARSFASMLYRELGVDPLAIEDVTLSHMPLTFPQICGTPRRQLNPTPELMTLSPSYLGELFKGVGVAAVKVDVDSNRRVAASVVEAQRHEHWRSSTVGAVLSSGDPRLAYAVTTGHHNFGPGSVLRATCGALQGDLLELEYVGHCEQHYITPERTPMVTLSQFPTTSWRTLVDVALFSFSNPDRLVPQVFVADQQQPGPPSVTVFPSAGCWGDSYRLIGFGRQIDPIYDAAAGRHYDGAPAGDRQYDSCGWIAAPIRVAPGQFVRLCLYLGRATSTLVYVGGHSGSCLRAVGTTIGSLHSFVCQYVHIVSRRSSDQWTLLGLTPAVLALEQARYFVPPEKWQCLQYVERAPTRQRPCSVS